MKRIARRISLWTLAVTLAWGAGGARAASPAVEALDVVGVEAQIVVVVPSLADASGKLTHWMNSVGLEGLMPDPLDSFKRKVGIEAGLDENGAMVMVIQNLQVRPEAEAPAEMGAAGEQADDEMAEPDLLLVFPVSDYAAFVGNWGGAGEGVSELTLPDGDTGYAKRIGDFAVLGLHRAAVEAYTPAHEGEQLAARLGAGVETLGGSEIALIVDVDKSRQQLKAGVEVARQEALAEMGAAEGPNAASARQMVELYFDAAQAVLDGTRLLFAGLDVTDEGLSFSKTMRMIEGSSFASYFPGGESTAAKELARLPNQPYIFAAALDAGAIDLGKVYAKLGQQQGETMRQMIGPAWEQAIKLGEDINALSFVFYTPDQMALMSGGLLNTVTVVTADDGQAYQQLLRQYIEQLNGQTQPMDPTQPQGPAITYHTTYTPGALNLGGVSVDQFQMQAAMPMELMQQMGPAAPFVNAFTTYRGYVAVQGQQVVVSTSVDPQVVTAALTAIAEGNGIGAEGVIPQQRRTVLPANPAAEVYVDIGGIAGFANLFMTRMGMPPIETPDDLPPVAVGLSVDGDTLHGRMFVPTASVKFVVETAQKIQAQFAQPPGPGGPATQPQPGGPAPY